MCAHTGVGHCTFQKYVAVWVTVPTVGATCTPADAATLCVCMRARESGAGLGGSRACVGVGERAIQARTEGGSGVVSGRAVDLDIRALGLLLIHRACYRSNVHTQD
jgi:hypothetical protein